MPSNKALFQDKAGETPFKLRESTYPSPKVNEITVKNHAVAINPADVVMQKLGNNLFPFITYPLVLGCDAAGEVVEVGSSITRFKVGDRVTGVALGAFQGAMTGGAFQEYVVMQDSLACKIPDSLSFEQASVLPLCLSTAANGLFAKRYLGLQYPSLDSKSTGKTVLITAGASSVGSNAIQLAVAAGYEVITTSSPENFDYVKKLGASQVFDYKSTTVNEDVIAAFKGKKFGGAMVCAGGSQVFCLEVVKTFDGNPIVASAIHFTEAVPENIKWEFINSSPDITKVICEDFLPDALSKGRYIAAPNAEVVGKGLESIQAAVDKVGAGGISASKIVVSL